MSKLIKWGLLAILAVAILIKVSLWLSVRSIMNDAIAQASPFMTLSYQGITSSFDGKVGVEGIKVQVPMLNDEFRIRHAELKFKSLGSFSHSRSAWRRARSRSRCQSA